MFKQFRYPTNRQALMAAIASAAVLITLVVLWLAVITHTALLNRQLDDYDAQRDQLTHETNLLWKQVGEITAPQEMERRMRDAGFVPPAGMEFLVQATSTVNISPTSSLGGGGK